MKNDSSRNMQILQLVNCYKLSLCCETNLKFWKRTYNSCAVLYAVLAYSEQIRNQWKSRIFCKYFFKNNGLSNTKKFPLMPCDNLSLFTIKNFKLWKRTSMACVRCVRVLAVKICGYGYGCFYQLRNWSCKNTSITTNKLNKILIIIAISKI